MWTVAGFTLVALLGIIGAFYIGKKYGQTKQQKRDAEARAEDMAHHASIASQPDVDRPLSKLRPR